MKIVKNPFFAVCSVLAILGILVGTALAASTVIEPTSQIYQGNSDTLSWTAAHFRLNTDHPQFTPIERTVPVKQCIGQEESCKRRRDRNRCCPGLTCQDVSEDYSGIKGAKWCVGRTEAD